MTMILTITSAAETTHPCSSFTFLLVSSTPWWWYWNNIWKMKIWTMKMWREGLNIEENRPDWKFPCWHLQLSPSCIQIPKHGRHSTLCAHREKEFYNGWFLPTQTSVASPQRNKSVMSSFWSSSFNMDSFWMQQRPLNVNTWLIKLRGKEFLISEFKKGYNLFEVVKEARVCVNKRFLPLQNCLCCHWNLRFNVF